MNLPILLSREGVFPVANGATGLSIAGTLQGEGFYAGMPSMFVRLQGCNLRCIWTDQNGKACLCDTAHTSFGPGNPIATTVDDVMETLRKNMSGNLRHVVVTGGEPMLQAKELAELLRRCKRKGWTTTVETNGTIFDRDVIDNCDLLSISPKLKSSIPNDNKLEQLGIKADGATRRHEDVISQIDVIKKCVEAASGRVQLKFVVGNRADESEIQTSFASLTQIVDNERIFLMPLGATAADIAESNKIVIEMCLRNGWRYTPRLHIDLFGSKEGV